MFLLFRLNVYSPQAPLHGGAGLSGLADPQWVESTSPQSQTEPAWPAQKTQNLFSPLTQKKKLHNFAQF